MRDRIYCRMKKGMPKDQAQKQPKIQKEKSIKMLKCTKKYDML